MKGMIITPKGAASLLLPGYLEQDMNWVSWDTPNQDAYHSCGSAALARARVQYILDMEEELHNGNGTIPRPPLTFSPSYCADSTLSVIIGLDATIVTHCGYTAWEALPHCLNPLPPTIKVIYSLCLYDIPTRVWKEAEYACSYVVPALHPTEYTLPDGEGTGPFTIKDMLGGILCTHVEGTQPCNALRELLRSVGHLPHTFLTPATM